MIQMPKMHLYLTKLRNNIAKNHLATISLIWHVWKEFVQEATIVKVTVNEEYNVADGKATRHSPLLTKSPRFDLFEQLLCVCNQGKL